MTTRIHWLAGWIFLIGCICLTGCKSTDLAHTGQMASVAISGHTEKEIAKETAKVFQANGYMKMEGLVFERKGSSWDTANYGGWSADSVWIRMRVKITSTEPGHYQLGCDAFVVEARGEIGMETEHKFMLSKRDECLQILKEIKTALDAQAAPGG